MSALAVVLTAGCETVPFRTADHRNTGVIGFGAVAPYVTARPGVSAPAPVAAPAPEPVPVPVPVKPTVNRVNVYAAARLSPAVRGLPVRLFAPHGRVVAVLDPVTSRQIAKVRTPKPVLRVVPSWDLKTLWLTGPGLLAPLNPRSLKPGRNLRPRGASALYFTPDGLTALLFTGRRLEFRDPHRLKVRSSMRLPCPATGPADFSADGSFLAVACAGSLLRLDWLTGEVTHRVPLHGRAAQVLLSPDGSAFFLTGPRGVRRFDAASLAETTPLRTSHPVESLAVTRDGATLFASGRARVTALALPAGSPARTWRLPAPATLDALSPATRTLWLHSAKALTPYGPTGRPLKPLKIAATTLTVFPQPGRYSLGRTYR
ncbi:hypothetical protein GCM10010468_69190 [Actinocorallia longicatena]|uniref:YncE family protein n=1 Tax=Actinocorallia longicatena TaxID=111803 RepID=A0ABP6QKU9_9ACTN